MRLKKDRHRNEQTVTAYFEYEPEGCVVPQNIENIMRLAIRETLRQEEFFRDAEISVTLCDGAYIRSLNSEYRNKDSETDVLSFPIFDKDEEDPIVGECIPLGDIVLNIDRATQQGAELGHSTLRECAFLTVHSMLHLLGYDHERSPEDEELMCERQRVIITAIEQLYNETEGTNI